MKTKLINICMVGIAAAVLSSCTVTYPVPVAVTNNKAVKTGETELTYWLGWIGPMHTDMSIKTAAENGGIKKVATVDYLVTRKPFRIIHTLKVTGE